MKLKKHVRPIVLVIILFFVSFTLLLAACQPSQIGSNTTSPHEDPSNSINSPATEVTQPTVDLRSPLTTDEIAKLQSTLEHPKTPQERYPSVFYSIALGQTYANPRDIDLSLFFRGGDYSLWSETDAEKALINSSIKDGEFMDHCRITPENMDTILIMCFGLTLADTKKIGLSQFVYSKDTVCYYTATTSPAPFAENLKIVSGFHEYNGDLEVTYTAGSGRYVMKLRPTDSGYHILSNLKA